MLFTTGIALERQEKIETETEGGQWGPEVSTESHVAGSSIIAKDHLVGDDWSMNVGKF